MARTGRPRRGNRERFESFIQVDEETGCWIWQGAKNKQGYGLLGVRMPSGEMKIFYAHRFSYQGHIDWIPEGMCVLHRCDTPSCVSPHCLFLGSIAENNADKMAKGRHVALCGESHGRSKLTDDQVREIRERYAAGGVTQQQLADEFGVSNTLIHYIVNRKKWTHI